MSPTPLDTYIPVVDISRHQGNVNFATMRSAGVEGLIIRSNHAHIVDDRCAEYVKAARAAGWRDDQLGYYTFCNPKRATAHASGKAFVDTVRRIHGHTNTLLMLDIEAYHTEPGSGPILQGDAFAAWIRGHIETVVELAPDCRLIAYSNAAFWNGDAYPVTGVHGPWVGDDALARELEWIVPRFPVYTPAGYVLYPLPGVDGWDEWAWRRGPTGPRSPSGAQWQGWQFSAGYNKQGPVYGCQSSDLDLNIVEASAWRRWTETGAPPPLPPPPVIVDEEEDAMKIKTPGQWFEKVGLDLRTIGNGKEFAGLPGNTVELEVDEMLQVVEACRYCYGPVKAEMGPAFAQVWNSKRQPVGGSHGGGGDHNVLVTVEARAV